MFLHRVINSLQIVIFFSGLLRSSFAALRHQFDFGEADFDENAHSWSSNGLQVILESATQFDREHHRIRFDGQYQANVTGLLDHSPTYKYYVGLWIYIYESPYNFAPFCLSIVAQFPYANTDCATECEVFWFTITHSLAGVTRSHAYVAFEDNCGVLQHYRAEETLTVTSNGWQYFGYYHEAHDLSSVPDQTSGKHKFMNFVSQDPTSTLQTTTLATVTSFSINSLSNPKLGYLVHSSARQRVFVGLMSRLTIHDEIPIAKEVSSRSAVLNMIDTYSYFWDFAEQSNNGWYKGKLSSQGYDYKGSLSEEYFVNINSLMPPYPSNKGWILAFSPTYARTGELRFNHSSQFTFEIEVFPYGGGLFYTLALFDDETSADTGSNWFAYIEFGTGGINFVTSTLDHNVTVIGVSSHRWSRVFVSWQVLADSSQVQICYFVRQLTCSGCSGYTNTQYCHTQDAAIFMPSFEVMVARIWSYRLFLRNFKVYNYALNPETAINDLDFDPPFLAAIDYSFTQEFNSYYYRQYLGLMSDVSDENNACMKYITPSTFCYCFDSGRPECANNVGYYYQRTAEESYMFNLDKCGTGNLSITPQIYECDDGNSDNGDGCDDHCVIEEEYRCIRLNSGESYCIAGCSNGIKATNEDCDDGNSFSGDGCSNACFLEDGYQCDITISPNICTPVCGDGQRTGDEECDDANDMNNDGCDGECKVEASYTCTEDASLGKDVCVSEYYPPIATNFEMNSQLNTAKVTFNDSMKNDNFRQRDIIISVTGPNEPYSISWTASYSSEYVLKIKFTVSPGILGGVGEVLKIKLANVDKFASQNHISLSNPADFTHYYDTLQPSAIAKVAGKGASYSFLLTVGTSVGISLLTGGSMDLMWSMTNTLQIIYYMSLLQLYFYSDLRVMMFYMSYADFDNPLTQLVSDYVAEGASLIPLPGKSKFEGAKLKSSNILANALDKLFLIALLFMFMLLFYLLFKCTKNQSNCASKLVKVIDMRLRYESTCRFLTELSLNLFVVSILNITYGRDFSIANIIGLGLSCLLLTLLCFMTIYSLVYPSFNFAYIKAYSDYNDRHFFLFLGFKKTHLKCYLYHGHFLARRLGLALVFVCLVDFVDVQCICLLILCGWITEYHLMYKPFKSQIINFLSCFNECILTAFCCVLFSFISNSNPTKIMFFGYTGVGVLAVFFLVNWCVIFVAKFIELAKSIKGWCSKRERVARLKTQKINSPLAPIKQADYMANNEINDAAIIQKYNPSHHSSKLSPPSTSQHLSRQPRHDFYGKSKLLYEEEKVVRPFVNPPTYSPK